MLDMKAFNELAKEIMSQGYDEETAYRYSRLIGDTPLYDDAGNILVVDGNQVLATLQPLKFFGN